MSNGIETMLQLQREMLRAGQANLALHKKAIDAGKQALKAHEMVHSQTGSAMKMWADWLDLWAPPK